MPQLIGVPRETFAGEKRVATVPEVVEKLIKMGFRVAVETGAGDAAQISDDAYRTSGAEVIADRAQLWATSDIVLKLRAGGTLVSFIWPAQNPELLQALAAKKATVLAMDSVPRISRAQKLDALSSMANIGGCRTIKEETHAFGRFFTGSITAAGKVPPAKVFVIGAGVAGLAAIGAASGLGAIVRANDTRPEVADQIKSLGGEYVPVDYVEEGSGVGGYAKVMSEGFQKAQREVFAKQAKDVDIIITTALIPGKPAPKLITEDMVRSMKQGSVIVDMAAEQGGNCELTVPGEIVVRHGVTIIGYKDLPSRLAKQASTLYATNLLRLTDDLVKTKSIEGDTIAIDMQDEVLRGTTVINKGEVTWPPPPPKLSAAPAASAAKPAAMPPKPKGHGESSGPMAGTKTAVLFGIGALMFLLVGRFAPASFLGHFTVFVLACFVGYMVVWNVTPALHTPLMSVTNAISSIIIIGALVQIAPPLLAGDAARPADLIRWIAVVGIALTAINMFGGFAVTQRMLS